MVEFNITSKLTSGVGLEYTRRCTNAYGGTKLQCR